MLLGSGTVPLLLPAKLTVAVVMTWPQSGPGLLLELQAAVVAMQTDSHSTLTRMGYAVRRTKRMLMGGQQHLSVGSGPPYLQGFYRVYCLLGLQRRYIDSQLPAPLSEGHVSPSEMHLPPLPHKLTFHPTPLSVRQAHTGRAETVVVLDGEMTFADFWPLFDGAGKGRTLPAPEARRLVRQLLQCSATAAWQRHADDAWAVARVHDALTELRLAGVTAKALASSEKLTALAAFLRAYENALQAHRWLDAADLQRLAVLQVAQGAMPPSLREVTQVEVLAGTELLGARLDVLRAFAARGVPVRVHMPWDEDRPHAFAWTEGLLHALETRGHLGMTLSFSPRHGRGALRSIVSALYTGEVAAAPVAGKSGPVVVRRAPAGLQHAESVAAQVAAWLAADVPAQTIAVVVPQAAMATEVVRALHGAGIGCAHSAQRSLAQSRIARLFLAGLRAPDGLASGVWWAELWETCGTTVRTPEATWSPGRVARALRRAGLATERRWGLEDSTAAVTATRAALAPLGLRQALPASCAKAVAAAMQQLCAPLLQVPESGTLLTMAPALLAWARALMRAWPHHDLAALGSNTLQPRAATADEPLATCAQPDADKALQAALLGDVEAATMLQQCVLDAVCGDAAADGVWTRAQMADWLAALCCERTYLVASREPQGVQVMRPEDAVGGRFRCVLFAGADMEAFPRPLPTNPFLPEAARIEVNRLLGPRLLQYAPMLGRGALPAAARDLWLWIEVLATASDHVVVTLQEGIGEAMLGPSELVDELLRVADIAMTATPSSGCINAVVPKKWLPRLWAAAPTLLAKPMQQVDSALPARLNRRWGTGERRTTVAQVSKTVAARLRQYFAQTVHSASRMDMLGTCAFRYAAAALWGLGTDDDIALGATPREQGSAAHAALHQVYDGIMHSGGMRQARLAPQQALDTAKAVMGQHTARILAETQVHPLLQPAFLAETQAAALAQLGRDLASDTPNEPVALEYTFDDRHTGGPDALCVMHPNSQSHVRVRGSIDRVDCAEAHVWVLDYKRTVRPRHPDRHFQLALYAAIALRDLHPTATQVRVGWAGLRPAKIHWAKDLPDTPEGLMAHLREHLFARIDPVADGNFSPDPDDPSTCDSCDFRRLCRLDDRSDPRATSGTSEATDGF